jgi:hypothetical protein
MIGIGEILDMRAGAQQGRGQQERRSAGKSGHHFACPLFELLEFGVTNGLGRGMSYRRPV